MKYFYLTLNHKLQKLSLLLFVSLIIAMLLENLGIALLVPFISAIINPEIINDYPYVKYYIDSINYFDLNLVLLLSILIFLLFFIKNIFLFLLSIFQSYFVRESHRFVAQKLFKIYLKMPFINFIDTNTATLIRNLTGEVFEFQYSLYQLLIFISEVLVLVGILCLLLYIEPFATIVIFFSIAILGLLYSIYFKNIFSKWGETRMIHSEKATKTIIESMSAIKEVRSYQKENFFHNRYKISNNISSNMNMLNSIMQIFPRIFLEIFAVSGLALIIILNYLFNDDTDILSSLVLYAVAGFRILPSVNRLLSALQSVRYANEVAKLIYDSFNNEKLFASKSGSIKNINFHKVIKFESIFFSYKKNDKFALSNINLEIKKGDSIGIIGTTGSGKSTFAQLLVGILNPDSGNITIDDQLISNSSFNINNLSYVPQHIMLVDDTIRNNIAFGINEKDIDDKIITNCIVSAGLENFITSLGDGINSNVGEKGLKLSGGQLQRIGIARALYRYPEIIVFDESTNALDEKTEESVLDYVYDLKIKKTIIIISHRLSSLKKCNKIIKFENGKILSIVDN